MTLQGRRFRQNSATIPAAVTTRNRQCNRDRVGEQSRTPKELAPTSL